MNTLSVEAANNIRDLHVQSRLGQQESLNLLLKIGLHSVPSHEQQLARAYLVILYFKGCGVGILDADFGRADKLADEATTWMRSINFEDETWLPLVPQLYYLLGWFYGEGLGVAKDCKKGFEYFKLSASFGFAEAITAVGYCYDHGLGTVMDCTAAVENYTEAAVLGHYLSEFNLSDCLRRGTGTAKDEVAAMNWLRKSADQGFVVAVRALAEYHDLGIAVEADKDKAFRLYEIAGQRGEPRAQHWLAEYYEHSDIATSTMWMRRAADQNFAGAVNSMGIRYELGKGVDVNGEEAVKYYRRAAELDSAAGMFNLGLCYSKGIGMSISVSESNHWMRLSADSGLTVGQYNIGLNYLRGIGYQKNLTMGIRYLKMAAHNGHIEAKKMLAGYRMTGRGICIQ